MSSSARPMPTRSARWRLLTRSSKRSRRPAPDDVPWSVAADKTPRLRPIAPGTIANNVSATEGLSDTELVARLYEALATLPPAERAAAVVAIGFDEGPVGVAIELGLDPADADAITRNALQLLRGA